MSAVRCDTWRMSDQVDQSGLPAGDGARPDAAPAAGTPLPAAELPVPLRRVANFAPNRRARLGAGPIATQLVADPLFRQRIAAKVLADAGELGAAVEAGLTP